MAVNGHFSRSDSYFKFQLPIAIVYFSEQLTDHSYCLNVI